MAQISIYRRPLLFISSLLAALAIFAVAVVIATESNVPAAQAKSRITVASNIRLRSAPNTSAEEIAKLQIGTIVRELEQSAGKEQIGNAEDYWHRVAAPDGKEGWVFGSFTAVFDPAKKEAAYRQIATERLKIEGLSFADLTDLVRFLSDSTREVKDRSALAELELARLSAMRRAAESIPADKLEQPIFQDWIKANEASLVYSEPAGQWLVKSDLFWDLQKKYAALPIAERIAWEAANNPLPGECEGDTTCVLGALTLTTGKCLDLYPRGAHAEEVINGLVEFFETMEGPPAPSEPYAAEVRASVRRDLAAIRAAVTKTASPKKTAVLQRIDKLAQQYR